MALTSDEILGRAEELIRRHGGNYLASKKRRERARKRFIRRLKRATLAFFAIWIAFLAAGLFIDGVGIIGFFLALLATVILVPTLLFSGGGDREVTPDQLPTTQLALLPLKTEEWLSTQRLALPAPATRLVDGIGVKLEALVPQLATLDEREPAAAGVRRLLCDDLPELVKGYTRVPPHLRRADTDGIVPETQLVEGLQTVDRELSRMSEDLARGDLTRLATQTKYLELKYQGGEV
jgi:preprotein translocase subunit Sss1